MRDPLRVVQSGVMGDGRWRSQLGVALVAAAALLSGCTSRTLSGTRGDDAEDASAGSADAQTDEVPDAGAGNDGDNVDGDGTDDDDDAASGASRGFDEGGDEECASFLACGLDAPYTLEMCDFWAQDCGEGRKCTVASTIGLYDAHVCVPAGPQPPGASCQSADGPRGTDTCDRSGFCYDIDDTTSFGTCVEFCQAPEAAPTCPQSGANVSCTKLYQSALNLCLPDCNPLLAGECSVGQTCVAVFVSQKIEGFICFPPGVANPGASGEECQCANCCASAHMCVSADDYGPDCPFDLCCTEYCEVGDSSFTCAGAGQSCTALFPPGTPLIGHVGRCQATP